MADRPSPTQYVSLTEIRIASAAAMILISKDVYRSRHGTEYRRYKITGDVAFGGAAFVDENVLTIDARELQTELGLGLRIRLPLDEAGWPVIAEMRTTVAGRPTDLSASRRPGYQRPTEKPRMNRNAWTDLRDELMRSMDREADGQTRPEASSGSFAGMFDRGSTRPRGREAGIGKGQPTDPFLGLFSHLRRVEAATPAGFDAEDLAVIRQARALVAIAEKDPNRMRGTRIEIARTLRKEKVGHDRFEGLLGELNARLDALKPAHVQEANRTFAG